MKRKIDFNEKQVDMLDCMSQGRQSNNKSNIKTGSRSDASNRMNLRRKLAVEPDKMTSNLENSWVQWTKEFMAKLKRSNEKARVKQRDSKHVGKVDARPGNNVNLSL